MTHIKDDYKPPNHCIGCKFLPKQVSHTCPCRPCNVCDDDNNYYTSTERSILTMLYTQLCPICVKKLPNYILGKATKGMCNICNSGNSYEAKYKRERYGNNGLNDKPNIEPTNGWN